jgi:ubiquinone/menaquinone biosynthesis C-methylase UbiE
MSKESAKKIPQKIPQKILQKSTLSKMSNTIVSLYNSPKWRPKLIPILGLLKYVNIKEPIYINIVEKYLNETTGSDTKIMSDLLKLKYTPADMYNEKSDIGRGFGKWKRIKTHIKPTNAILDFGGNVGTTAMVIGRKILKLPKENTFVVDIDDWSGNKWTPRNDITFIHYDHMEEIPDSSIDLITCFHTLHHISNKDYPRIIKQFYRILSPKGCVVLFEHNCTNNEWAELIDLEHAFYDIIVSKKITYNKFVQEDHYAKYLSINKWNELFEKYGFKSYYIDELHNKDNSFYSYFSKDFVPK